MRVGTAVGWLRTTGGVRGVRIGAGGVSVLSSGVLLGTVAALTPSKRGFDSRTYVTVQQATVRNLRPVMGFLLPASAVANLAMLVGPERADPVAPREHGD